MPFPRHYRIVRHDDYWEPQFRFLGIFWLPCYWIDDRGFLFPRGIRCEYRQDAERVVSAYHDATCPGRDKAVIYKDARSRQ